MPLWLSGVTEVLLALQAASASVSGAVRDEVSGEPLAGAIVALTDLERITVTDADGRYTFTGVPAGPQHVVVRRIGYASRTLHALVPRQGTVEINITLAPRPITLGAVAARFAIPVRGLDDGDGTALPNRGLSIAAVRHHPQLAEPDVFQALNGGEVVLRPESPSGIHVRGGASDQVAYLLDRLPVLSPYHAAGTFSAWNPDALSRLHLSTSSPAFPDALSGVVSATTRTPGSRFGAQGSISSTHARVTIDGPLGWGGGGGMGYLLSVRSGFPGFPAPPRESSYLRGETGDWLAKVESPLAGGRIRVLGYGSDNELDAAATVVPEGAAVSVVELARNAFAWHSRSLGGEWTRQLGRVGVSLGAWSAAADAGAVWNDEDSVPDHLAAQRRDEGLLATVELTGDVTSTATGIRTQQSWTSYRLQPAAGGGRALVLNGGTPVTTGFVQHTRSFAAGTDLALGVAGALAAGHVHLSPHAELRWQPTPTLSVSGSYARRHQFAQSLRNAESVVGNVFPADLYVGVGTPGVPVARSDQGIAAVEYRPAAGVRLAAQAYGRAFDGLVLVAPQDPDPFATTGFVVGSGTAHGFSVEGGASGARYGIMAGYGLQHVRFEYGDTSYVPEHGAAHSIEAGVIVFPSTTFSIRLGAIGVVGRRTTALGAPLEWEACNLLDQGCEFGGSPQQRFEPLGATRLPAYVRVDLGIRKHWHLKVAGRDGLVAVFGTVTNLFGRRNALTVAPDPETGERGAIEMRPRAPLVVGLDWRF